MSGYKAIMDWIPSWRRKKRKQPLVDCIGLIRGQAQAKQALLLAAAGNHNLLLIGPPGEGKTHLVSTLPGFLPGLAAAESEQLHNIYSESGEKLRNAHDRPFRAVHHSTSIAGLIGGYSASTRSLCPGEISYAHNGVLFLDELTEFKRETLDALRQPIESGFINVTRSGQSRMYLSRFQLIAASNPCKCGYAGTPHCSCSPHAIDRYLSRISGPIIDRIDIITSIKSTTSKELSSSPVLDQSLHFKTIVLQARLAQYARNGPSVTNSLLQLTDLEDCTEKEGLEYLFSQKDKQPKFSTRKLIRCLRVARTIADILERPLTDAKCLHIALEHVNFDLQGEYLPCTK